MKRYYFTRALALGAALCGAAPVFAAPLADDLIRAAPDASADAIRLALAATECAVAHGQPPAERLAVIDYSRASTEPRLWVFDLAGSRLLYREWVAHGRNSGDNYARTFSNAAESHASSLGLFRTLDTYQGHNGYSLRLDGLEPGFNDHALERAIVMHGAAYVNPEGATARRPPRSQLRLPRAPPGRHEAAARHAQERAVRVLVLSGLELAGVVDASELRKGKCGRPNE